MKSRQCSSCPCHAGQGLLKPQLATSSVELEHLRPLHRKHVSPCNLVTLAFAAFQMDLVTQLEATASDPGCPTMVTSLVDSLQCPWQWSGGRRPGSYATSQDKSDVFHGMKWRIIGRWLVGFEVVSSNFSCPECLLPSQHHR